jgi:PIN domain nuclease of toxin-antitoxin system
MATMLLDSHALLWLLDDNPRLGRRARSAIKSSTRVHVSAATVWELTIKSMLGKISVPTGLSERLVDQGLSLLSISAQDAEAIRSYPELIRHDPFDRLLVAQAERMGMRLLTADQVLLDLKRDFLVDARE